MVERISRISSSEASSQTETGHTLNLGSDSQNAWVGARQSKINHDIEERQRDAADERRRLNSSGKEDGEGQHTPHIHHWAEPSDAEEAGNETGEPRLSGESERIGTQNFDEDTPFGNRVVIV